MPREAVDLGNDITAVAGVFDPEPGATKTIALLQNCVTFHSNIIQSDMRYSPDAVDAVCIKNIKLCVKLMLGLRV
jgi:hypothetical protein